MSKTYEDGFLDGFKAGRSMRMPSSGDMRLEALREAHAALVEITLRYNQSAAEPPWKGAILRLADAIELRKRELAHG